MKRSAAPSPQSRPTYTLTAREYAFWLWGLFATGLLLGGIFGAWIW